MNLSNNKILITGGATGIGFGIAERFIQEGNTVIICGRREAALAEAAQKLPGVITKVCDLAAEGERKALYDWVSANHPDLNVLVNNAGIQQWMSLEDEDFYERAKAEITTNIEAPVHLTALFSKLPSLRTIMNVTSGLAFVPFAKVPVYSATKAFVHSFTRFIQYLLQAKGIEVIEVVPPALNTDLGAPGLHNAAPPVSDFVASIFAQLKDGKPALTFGTSEARYSASREITEPYFNQMNPAKP